MAPSTTTHARIRAHEARGGACKVGKRGKQPVCVVGWCVPPEGHTTAIGDVTKPVKAGPLPSGAEQSCEVSKRVTHSLALRRAERGVIGAHKAVA